MGKRGVCFSQGKGGRFKRHRHFFQCSFFTFLHDNVLARPANKVLGFCRDEVIRILPRLRFVAYFKKKQSAVPGKLKLHKNKDILQPLKSPINKLCLGANYKQMGRTHRLKHSIQRRKMRPFQTGKQACFIVVLLQANSFFLATKYWFNTTATFGYHQMNKLVLINLIPNLRKNMIN